MRCVGGYFAVPIWKVPNLSNTEHFFVKKVPRKGRHCKGKAKITLEQAMKAQKGSRGIALLFI